MIPQIYIPQVNYSLGDILLIVGVSVGVIGFCIFLDWLDGHRF